MTGYDLHLHTEASFDCRSSLDEIIETVVARGLAGVAVTDHDTLEGALRLRDRRPPFQVIVGCEITLDTGVHIIGLFLDRPVRQGSLAAVAAAIRAQGGLVVVPHPFRPVTGLLGCRDCQNNITGILEHVDMIEVFNSKSTWAQNQRAIALAREAQMPASAGSDAHRASDIGQGVMIPGDSGRLVDAGLLRTAAADIRGIHQEDRRVRLVRNRRDRVRRAALGIKRLLPDRWWRTGKNLWDDWCLRHDRDREYPIRNYGRFAGTSDGHPGFGSKTVFRGGEHE